MCIRDRGHPRLRVEGKDWMTTENGAVTAGTNGRVKGKRRTTTIRIAMQPPKQVASVRDVYKRQLLEPDS